MFRPFSPDKYPNAPFIQMLLRSLEREAVARIPAAEDCPHCVMIERLLAVLRAAEQMDDYFGTVEGAAALIDDIPDETERRRLLDRVRLHRAAVWGALQSADAMGSMMKLLVGFILKDPEATSMVASIANEVGESTVILGDAISVRQQIAKLAKELRDRSGAEPGDEVVIEAVGRIPPRIAKLLRDMGITVNVDGFDA